MNQRARARGALTGLALGDALGMPTQCLPFELVRSRYTFLTDAAASSAFQPGPPDNELSAGMAAGRVTDDTDQAVILGRLLVEGNGVVDQRRFADELLAWEARMKAAGSLDLLGPSTLRALTQVAAGAALDSTGRWGDTNGAAMRITPMGIAHSAHDLDALVDAVHLTGRVTHDTGTAVAGAAAVAAAVSAGLDGADISEATDLAIEAAHLGRSRGHYVPGADVAARISWALDVVNEHGLEPGLESVVHLIGTSVATQESVPAAFAVLALVPHDPWLAVRAAASLGGDCDTIGAIVGAIAGACAGIEGYPTDAVEILGAANPDLALDQLADDLLALRITSTLHNETART